MFKYIINSGKCMILYEVIVTYGSLREPANDKKKRFIESYFTYYNKIYYVHEECLRSCSMVRISI